MTTLREILKSSSSDYYSRFKHIESSAKYVISNSRIFFPTYTNHDFKHLENVEENIDNMLTEDVRNNLSDEEIFCLLSATWLHDIGMIPVNDEKEKYGNMNPLERENYSGNVRSVHNIRSKCYIENKKEELKLDDFEADIIGKICKGHRQVDLNEYIDKYSKTKVRLPSLSAILRLADECDVSHKRESILSEDGVDDETKEEHYRIHKLVRSPVFDYENGVIKIVSIGYDENDKKLLEKTKDKIQSELDEISVHLKKIGLEFNQIKLDCMMDKSYVKKIIILSIIHDKDIYSSTDDWIKKEDIDNCLEELMCDKIILKDKNGKYIITNEINLFKDIFRMFLNEGMNEFFFTGYVESMIKKSIGGVEKKFSAQFDNNERKIRTNLLKNSPTASYMLLFVDEIINYPSFNLSSLQDGDLLFDSIISLGIFNDIHRYSDSINFENMYENFNNLKLYDLCDVEKKINFYKALGEVENE